MQFVTFAMSCLTKGIFEAAPMSCTSSITLLFFLSKGHYPIYDKYAHIALKVILERMDYKEVVTDKALNCEFHNGTKKYLDDYKTYIEKLESIFGKEYATDRRIDQALWAYGHLFSDTKINRKK